ncbi:AMP-binding protein [Rhodococcus hoagii]|nr:AMP-binding protein [Prescottella equi]
MPATSTLPQVLSAVVEAEPRPPAIADDGTEITYGELDERSSRLARVLIAEGVGPGTRVPVALARSVDAVIAAWAVLKSGGSGHPDRRERRRLGIDRRCAAGEAGHHELPEQGGRARRRRVDRRGRRGHAGADRRAVRTPRLLLRADPPARRR